MLVWTDIGVDAVCRWVVNDPPRAALDAIGPSDDLIPQGLVVSARDVYVLNTPQWAWFEWDMSGWNNRLRPIPFVTGQSLPVEIVTSIDLDPIMPVLPAFDGRPGNAGDSPRPRGPVAILTGPAIHPPIVVAVDRAGSTSHASDTANGGVPAAGWDGGGSQAPAAGLTPGYSIVSVPQPPSLMLLAFSSLGLLWRRRHSMHRPAR